MNDWSGAISDLEFRSRAMELAMVQLLANVFNKSSDPKGAHRAFTDALHRRLDDFGAGPETFEGVVIGQVHEAVDYLMRGVEATPVP